MANCTKVDGHLLCRIHYMKKVMESGGKLGGDEKFRVNTQNDRFKQYSSKNLTSMPPENGEPNDKPTDETVLKSSIQSESSIMDEVPPVLAIEEPKTGDDIAAVADIPTAPTVEELLTEIELLRRELVEERERRRALDEECDSLAMANCLLIEELTALRRRSSVLPQRRTSTTPGEDTAIIEGDGKYAKIEKLKIANAAGGTNVLSVCFLHRGPSSEQLLVCGGADRKVYGYSNSGEQIFSQEFSAPVLSVDSYQDLLAISCMDGSHAILRSSDLQIQNFHDHSKYVIFIRWSVSGKFFATACYDKSVNIYAMKYAYLLSILTLI